MNRLSSFTTLLAVALTGMAATHAWSEEATQTSPAAPAVQAPAPVSGVAPGWYPPPMQGGYAQPWQQPPRWPTPPRGYGQPPPQYPSYTQSRSAPAAPAATENPLRAELELTQAQLAEKSAELNNAQTVIEQFQLKLQHSLETERLLRENLTELTGEQETLQARVSELSTNLNTSAATLEENRQRITNGIQQIQALAAARDQLRSDLASRDAQLASLQAELQAATQALQQAQSEASAAGEQLDAARAQAESAGNELTALKTQLEQQQSAQLNTTQGQAAELDSLRSDLASRDAQLASLQAELQAATQALQQAQSEASAAGEQLDAARAQAESAGNELTALKTQLEQQQSAQLNTEQTLATVTAERDGLLADMATVVAERDRLQEDLAVCNRSPDSTSDTQSELDTPQREEPAAADIIAVPVTGVAGKDEPVTADTDKDGVPDNIDLCPETQPGSGVDSTGCTPGAAISLEGVNFLYNSHELTDEARGILDRVASIIVQHPDLRLEVAGHTDATGDPSYNQWLSLQRAEAVREYLVAQGVNPRYIGATGYGGQRPIADNSTSVGLQKNRRVELRRLQ